MSEILNFGEATQAARLGRLHIYLETLDKKTLHVTTLLHIACMYPNSIRAIKMLIRNGCNVNAPGYYLKSFPLHFAIRFNSHIEVLFAAGANPNLVDALGRTPMRYAREVGALNAQLMLIACGVRVQSDDNPILVHFQRSVLSCRSRVIALLLVKKTCNLWRWDKFLFREIAYAVWSTRKF